MAAITPSRSHTLDRGDRKPRTTPKLIALDSCIRHALTCPTCTAAAGFPGAERCPAGAVLWAAYLIALPTESKTETRPSQTDTRSTLLMEPDK